MGTAQPGSAEQGSGSVAEGARMVDSSPSRNELAETVTMPAELARLIDKVFLPKNPNKMRGAAPEVIQAAHDFKTYIAGQKPWRLDGK